MDRKTSTYPLLLALAIGLLVDKSSAANAQANDVIESVPFNRPVQAEVLDPATGLTAERAQVLDALQQSGQVTLELGDAADPSVVADAASLVLDSLAPAAPYGSLAAAPAVTVTYLGKGRLGKVTPDERNRAGKGTPPSAEPPTKVSSMIAFNGNSRNEFRLTMPMAGLRAENEKAAALGLDSESGAAPRLDLAMNQESFDDPSTLQVPGFAPDAWSNGIDSRYRVYGLNAAVTSTVDKRMVHFDNGCSGSLVGKRHVVTAAHCIYSRANQQWADDFWVRRGRNGSSSQASVFVDNDKIPAGQILWYFTPSKYRDPAQSNTAPYDFGVPVLVKGVDGASSELAITNVVPKPGFTDFAIYLYDPNGYIDNVCEKLNQKQVEYISAATWGYLPPAFRGSAVISAVYWEHDVFDGNGTFVRNVVGLGATAVERYGLQANDAEVPGDESTATGAPPAFDFFLPDEAPNCPGVGGIKP